MVNEFLKLIDLNDEYALFDGDCLKLYKIPKSKISEIEEFMSISRDRYFADLSSVNRLARLTMCVSDVCNLACKYCYEGKKNCIGSNSFMSDKTIEKAIDFAYQEYSEGIHCVQFFGGEPLLNIRGIEYAIEYISNLCKKFALDPPLYTIVTNGTLINDQVHRLFNRYFSRITISLDGKKDSNDANRIFRSHNGSVYETIISNIQRFSGTRQYNIDVQMTITEEQLRSETPDISDYLHIKNLGVESVHITPLINTKDYQIGKKEIYTSRIIQYFQKCYEYEMQSINQTNYYKLLKLVHTLKTKTPSDYYCGAGFLDISVDVSGDIYPCFMFNGDGSFVMGNVCNNTKSFRTAREKYINNRISRNKDCANCWAHGICNNGHSGCIGAFYLENGKINEPITYNCRITKSIFERVLANIAMFSEHTGD